MASCLAVLLLLSSLLVSLVLHGSGSLPDAAPFTADSSQPGDRFGASLAAAGDVDGDGWPDVLVGAPGADGAGTNSGRAELRSGRDGRALLVWEGDDPFDALGSSLAAVGDLDGDGVVDLGLGAPAGSPGAGSVRLVSGQGGQTLFTLVGEAVGDRFGHALCAVGDVDGDGVPDLAVSAPHADMAGANAGRVYLASGADGVVLRVWDGAGFDQLGQSLAGVGDVDGDGIPDLLVGAPLSDLGAFNGGAALLFSGADGSELAVFSGQQVGDQLGFWVASVGDVDGDGTSDLGLGVPGHDGGGIDAGAVQVRSGASGALLFMAHGASTSEGLGVVAAAGDVDGDGRDDVALGAATAGPDGSHVGRVRLVSGATGQDLVDRLGRRPFGWLGFALAGVGDLDGDGRADVVAGAPGHDDVLTIVGAVRAVPGP